jgi:uncharacterized RDD family membrane protein YckC
MESSPPIPTSLIEEPQVPPSGASQTAFHEDLSDGWTAVPLHKRALAYCVDWGILGALSSLCVFFGAILVVFFLGFFSGQLKQLFAEELTAVVLMVLLALVILLVYLSLVHLYFIYYHLKRGATPGKQVFGLKVISLDNGPLSREQCILRECLVYIDVGLFLPGLISIVTTQRNQRLGDLAAGTMVIHSRQMEEQSNYLYITQEEYHMLESILMLKPISSQGSEEYLRFAYKYFITKQVVPSSDELANWEVRARRYIVNAEEHGLDQQSVLLFLAEHCFQIARS